MTNSLNADARWDAAAALARSVAVPKIRSRRWWAWAWIVSAVIAVGALGFSLTSWIVPVGGEDGVEVVDSLPTAQWTLFTAYVLLLAYGVFWGSVTERLVDPSSTIKSPLSRTEKRNVRRQLAGKVPADENRLPTVLAIARQNQRITEAAVPQLAALVFLYASIKIGVVDSDSAYEPYLSIAVALTLTGSALYLAIVYFKTARFVRAHDVRATKSHLSRRE